MKRIIKVLAAVGLCTACVPPLWAAAAATEVKAFAEKNIIWHGQSAFEVRGEITVFTDPFKLKTGGRADVILITHPHQDHLSPADIQKVRTPETVIVAPDDPEARRKLSGDVRFVKPGDQLTVKGMEIQAVPAYNRAPKVFHSRSKHWVGYIVTINSVRMYLAGDTDRIPEMQELRPDIALLPVGGTYTMNAKEAASAALDLQPKLAIPMHYGSVVGSAKDAETFRKLLAGQVEVLVKRAE